MAQQQQQRRDDQFQNISRTNNSDIQKNDGIFGNRTATEPVAAYPVTEQAYVTTATGNAPGGVGGTTTTTRYEYTAIYGTPAAPGFDSASAGGDQWGQEANNTGGGGGGDNTGMKMNMNMGRDKK
ncbi:unnamed protein product [Trifolium pratense]|uniref:Uncharacterized protein n=1 Tax=Trifolium pratense TaxID=57577 RepID=A0ACB0IXY1_TRIPR|nr:unnamed protein product [Trifolium pratense]